MSFTFAFQPELIRTSQKDQEIIQQIYQCTYNLLEYFFSSRQIYNNLNLLKMLSNLTYYLITYGKDNQTIGEEYTNVQAFNSNDYDNDYVPILKKRRIIFIILQFIQFSLPKLRSQLINKQQSITNKIIKNIPDLNDIVENIQEFHLALFLMGGQYFEISKRLTKIQLIFNRIPPNHNIQYNRIGKAYLILLIFQFIKFIYNTIKKIRNEQQKTQVNKELNINQNQDNDKFTQCLICYDSATNLTCTPCGHLYCWECIQQQTLMKQQCPICRSKCEVQQLVQLYNYN